MDASRIIQHLVNFSKGECTITEESILKLETEDEQNVELGLLTLFEEIQYNKKKLEDSNYEKEILLKEIHHRVKNNLQIISSLLSLQGKHIEDSAAVQLLDDCCMRVKTMSIIHEKLYKSKHFGIVSYKDYLEELLEHLAVSYTDLAKPVKIKTDIPAFTLNLDTAIPLGLLLNEILTNSFKYGIDEDNDFEIYLTIKILNPSFFEIEIGDNGTGYDDEAFLKSDVSLGIQLIHALTDQLEGSIIKLDSKSRKGTHYKIGFEA